MQLVKGGPIRVNRDRLRQRVTDQPTEFADREVLRPRARAPVGPLPGNDPEVEIGSVAFEKLQVPDVARREVVNSHGIPQSAKNDTHRPNEE